MIIIKTKNYKSTDDFIYDVLGKYEEREESDCINIVAHYDVMIDILNRLVKTTDFDMFDIKICDVEVDNYADEYILTIYDGKIWCQEAKYDTGYLNVDDLTFVHSDCNSKFTVKNRDVEMIEFSIGEEESEWESFYEYLDLYVADPKLNIGQTETDNESTPGFTATLSNDCGYSSYSFYSDDETMVREMLEVMKSIYERKEQ